MIDKIKRYFAENWKFLLLCIFVLYTRIIYLDIKGEFWHDEAFQYLYSQNSVGYILQSNDVHTPLYNLFAHYIIPFIGNNPYDLRLFGAAIFSYLAILFFYGLIKQMFDEDTALYTSVLLALSPTFGWFGAEFRSYSFVLFIMVWQIIFFNAWLREQKNWQMFGWLALSFLAIYSHALSILIIFVQIPFAVLYRKKFDFKLRIWLSLFVIGCIPLLVHAMNVLRQSESFWFKDVTLWSLISTFAYLISPPLDRFTGVALMIYGLIIWYLWHNRRNISLDIWQFILYATVPVIIMFIANQLGFRMFHHRYFLFGALGIYLLAGLAVKHLEQIRPQHGEFVLAGIGLILFMSINFIPINTEIQDSTRFFANMTNYSTVSSSQFSQTPLRFYLPCATHYLLTNFTDKQLFTAGGSVIINKIHSIDEIPKNTLIYYITEKDCGVAMFSEGGLNVCKIR